MLWHHAGGAIQCVAFLWNTGPLGNGIAIWLGIEPADLFLYIFLPPMLVDSAVRIDFYIFRRSAQPAARIVASLCMLP